MLSIKTISCTSLMVLALVGCATPPVKPIAQKMTVLTLKSQASTIQIEQAVDNALKNQPYPWLRSMIVLYSPGNEVFAQSWRTIALQKYHIPVKISLAVTPPPPMQANENTTRREMFQGYNQKNASPIDQPAMQIILNTGYKLDIECPDYSLDNYSWYLSSHAQMDKEINQPAFCMSNENDALEREGK